VSIERAAGTTAGGLQIISFPARTIISKVKRMSNRKPIAAKFYSPFTVPGSRLFAFYSLFSRRTPTPPYGLEVSFGHYDARNLHGINNMHFFPVDESVTANSVFCPF
jgi:hypothetical protein